MTSGHAEARQRNAAVATAIAAVIGVAWGLFWLPMRAIDAAGVRGAWATVSLYVALAIVVLPLAIVRLRRGSANYERRLIIPAGIAGGLSLSLYATSFLYTDVIHAILLYYMTPVWSALLERLILGEPLRATRLVALALGLAGLVLVLGTDGGLPLPDALGDWMALVGGVLWAFAALALYRARSGNDMAYTSWYTASALGFSLIVALLPGPHAYPLPAAAAVLAALPFILLLAWGVLLATTLVIPWITRHAGPTRTSLMYMLETPIAGLTAAWLAAESIGWPEIAGAVLILTAGVLDTFGGHVHVSAPGAIER